MNILHKKVTEAFEDDAELIRSHKQQRIDSQKRIGMAIKDMRIGTGVTTGRLADKLGVAYQYIVAIEAGKRKPSKQLMEKIYSVCASCKNSNQS